MIMRTRLLELLQNHNEEEHARQEIA